LNNKTQHNSDQALVTGAHGFVGRALCETLQARGWHVRRAVRANAAADEFAMGDLGPETNGQGVMDGIDCVVHLAARTHIIHDTKRDVISTYRRTNVAGTVALAKAAAQHGVRRFVFLSSIKVNGERTSDHPFTKSDPPRPEDPYGISKHEAEQALWQIAKETGLEVVILRPPLVYGPAVKANFLRLMHLCACRTPLPLASIENARSLIYLGNLVDAIAVCMRHPLAAGKTFLVSDGEDVSTPELVRRISAGLGTSPRLLPVRPSWLGWGSTFLGRKSEWDRLAGSLQIDSARIRDELDWRPTYTMTQGLAETARWYHSQFPVKSK
jgi:nucleoside-diphosphate-sugar epimerase